MNGTLTCLTVRRGTAYVAILIIGAAIAIGPDAFAWGRRIYGGGDFGREGYGMERYGGGGFNQGGGYGYGGGYPSGGASQMYIYPSRGQSPQQEQSDRAQCYNWAMQQSRFNPANPQIPGGPPPEAGAPQGGMFRGAAGGAAMGAVGGAIGGHTGEGAAIGAAAGGVFGGMRRRNWQEQQEFQQSAYMQQQQNAMNQGRGNFNQAFAVCMTGRGYTVG